MSSIEWIKLFCEGIVLLSAVVVLICWLMWQKFSDKRKVWVMVLWFAWFGMITFYPLGMVIIYGSPVK